MYKQRALSYRETSENVVNWITDRFRWFQKGLWLEGVNLTSLLIHLCMKILMSSSLVTPPNGPVRLTAPFAPQISCIHTLQTCIDYQILRKGVSILKS